MKFALLALLLFAPQPPRYVRQDVRPDYVVWREINPTTFHGICASLFVGKTKWGVDHPYGHKREENGQIASTGSEERVFASKAEAEAWAESVCPTKEYK